MTRLIAVALAIGGSSPLPPVAAAPPAAEEIAAAVRPEHPRLFLTPETIPVLRSHALNAAAAHFAELLKRVEAYPEHPSLELDGKAAEIRDDKVVFAANLKDRNLGQHAVKMTGGREAMECAVAYVVTGEKRYLAKAKAFLRLNIEFCRWCDRHKLLPEWYHYGRMCAIVAYDWLYNELTPEERASFILPMLQHIEHMRNPGYGKNNGGPMSGNYGEPGLQWYAGVAAAGDGFDDRLAGRFLLDGARLNVEMMDFRDFMSESTGLLTTPCVAYSFATYPFSSYNFLHTLKSAAGLDGTEFWTQMRDFADCFVWSIIVGEDGRLLEHGWGDTAHLSNGFPVRNMYTHLAQSIHFYPEKAARARAAIGLLPETEQKLSAVENFPFLPFILTGFDPDVPGDLTVTELAGDRPAAHFPSFGLTFMRSGLAPESTYAAFKGGSRHDMHQHYDENSFIIYKKGFQALDTGRRGGMPHHRVYYAQSIAHNTILIRMPEEPLPPYWYADAAPKIPADAFNDGGQNRQKAARSLGFSQSAWHVALGGDATRCYSEAKCREAVRQFVYIVPDYFIVYDRVTSVRADQEKVFLLHTQNEPERIAEDIWRSCAGGGVLHLKTLLPQPAKTVAVGGPGREFMVNGVNYPPLDFKNIARKPNWLGGYRLEVAPAEAAAGVRFLHLISVAGEERVAAEAEVIREEVADRVRFVTVDGREVEVAFRRDGEIGGEIKITRNGRELVNRPLYGSESGEVKSK